MSEVEKMYENCNFEKSMGVGSPLALHPFTAEKQLELIKWLMCQKQTIQVELRLYENDYCISHITECEHNNAVEYVETGRKNTFDEALADLVNDLWQDLTEEERKQIKEILE